MSEPMANEVTFANGAVNLTGSVAFPRRGAAAVPGIVLIGGSGPADRDNDTYFPPLRQHLVDAGFAVLSYDKRGVGTSSGDWRKATLEDFAADAAAALTFLRAQPEVQSTRVGMFGHSEGGWVALRATAGREDLPWVVTSGCPGVTPAVQERHELANIVRAGPSPHTERTLSRALDLYDSLMEAGRRDASFEELEGLVAAAGNPSWPGRLWGELDPSLWEFLKRKQDHDPLRDARRLSCPHLALFGAADPVVPVAESIGLFSAAAGHAERHPHATLTVEVFPGSDHRVQVDDGSCFAPGYLKTVARWLTTRDAAPGPASS
ncbi:MULTISPECIES: alpha/beta hydrolase family protein [unclassified Streptomyces]|uniref:alpha/beta hydrolase family protein n=1 Tax=unclassified Streptomyces TaxID=2593676 RepID=UPI0035D75C95